MTTILVGVDASDRSRDALAFARQVASAAGRVLRDAACPVVVLPRGVESPLGELFAARTAA